jgi:predicted TIM-barrel fold metal-dependent hydrolase
MMIIDCHCHAGEGDGFTGPWDTRAPLKKFMQWSSEAGIQKTVLFSAFHSDYVRANKLVADIVQQYPDRFYGFAFLHADRDRGRIAQMVRTAVDDYGFCGLKIHRHDARISREICEAAKKFKLPVLYDPTGEISTVELIATDYPEVNFIIPHLSSFADDWRAQISFVDMLVRHKNVFTDTSGVRRFDVLEMAYKRAGAHKIIFGTDGPWLHPAVEIAKVYALKLPEKELSLVLGGNWLRLTQNRNK